MRSTDGGKTWSAVSRLADADLHKIVLRHDRLYAFDAILSAMLISTDGGKTFKEEFTPRGLVIDFEVDPADPERIIASTETELFRTEDAGHSWRPLTRRAASASRGRTPEALYRADADGTVKVLEDGGTRWKDVGAVGGEPYELRATGPEGAVSRAQRRIDPRDHGRRRHMARSLPALTLAARSAGRAPTAHGHSLVAHRAAAGLAYISSDAVLAEHARRSGAAGDEIEFRDPTANAALDIGPCGPGEVSGEAA